LAAQTEQLAHRICCSEEHEYIGIFDRKQKCTDKKQFENIFRGFRQMQLEERQ
jgi:hypothetical protein